MVQAALAAAESADGGSRTSSASAGTHAPAGVPQGSSGSSGGTLEGHVAAGEVVQGEMGGSFDELTRRSIQGMAGSGGGRPQ